MNVIPSYINSIFLLIIFFLSHSSFHDPNYSIKYSLQSNYLMNQFKFNQLFYFDLLCYEWSPNKRIF